MAACFLASLETAATSGHQLSVPLNVLPRRHGEDCDSTSDGQEHKDSDQLTYHLSWNARNTEIPELQWLPGQRRTRYCHHTTDTSGVSQIAIFCQEQRMSTASTNLHSSRLRQAVDEQGSAPSHQTREGLGRHEARECCKPCLRGSLLLLTRALQYMVIIVLSTMLCPLHAE